MAFLDDLGKKLGAAADITAAKTKELTEVAKINMRISSEERKIEKLFSEIGKLVFEKEKDKSESFVAEQCSKILEIGQKIEELNKKLDEIAQKHNSTPSGIAIAWILRHPAKMQPIAGTTNADRLKEICAGSDVELTREEWYEIYRSAGNNIP
jgi:tetrahydromethanopterin S-methyltransferase subunit G